MFGHCRWKTVKEIYNLTKSYPIEERYGLICSNKQSSCFNTELILRKVWEEIIKKIQFNFFMFQEVSAYELETLLECCIDDKYYWIIKHITK